LVTNCILNGTAAFAFLLATASGVAQAQASDKSTPAAPVKQKHAYYIDPQILNLAASIPAPPDPGSPQFKAELAEVHRIESERTPAQVAAAQGDDREEDIFIYRGVVGDQFTAANFPILAELSAHVHNDEPVEGNPIKDHFKRQRPYQFDKSLHPVCKTTDQPDSYPSGHTITGYLLALTLIQMLPEKQSEILTRADYYAHNRLVCGVHYESDLKASQRVAYAEFGYLLATPRFQRDLTRGGEELRTRLGLQPLSKEPE